MGLSGHLTAEEFDGLPTSKSRLDPPAASGGDADEESPITRRAALLLATAIAVVGTGPAQAAPADTTIHTIQDADRPGQGVLKLASIDRELAFDDQGSRGARGGPEGRNLLIVLDRAWLHPGP